MSIDCSDERRDLEKLNFLDQKSYLSSPHCDQKPSSENMIKNYRDRDGPQRRQKGKSVSKP